MNNHIKYYTYCYGFFLTIMLLTQLLRLAAGYPLDMPSAEEWLKSFLLVLMFSYPLSCGKNCWETYDEVRDEQNKKENY